jgi:hypothetical protein
MANTTSGTTTFDKTFAIDEIIEESYERIGLQNVSGNQLRMARRSLNIMFQEWGNRGLHYWEVANNSITLVAVKQNTQCLDQQVMAHQMLQLFMVLTIY